MQQSFARICSPGPIPQHLCGGTIAIGNFDGVHRGHQAVLDRARADAASRAAPALVLTFEPHPRKFFRPEQPVFLLTPGPVRARLLAALGFDAVVEQPFDRELSQYGAEEFIDRILIGRLGVGHVVAGVDFHFGKGREGNPAFLEASGARHGFGVSLVEPFRDENDEVISSSRIRSLLEGGSVAEAAGLLGYRYTVEAGVNGGDKLGRTLGFPTANMRVPAETGLAHGIYAVRFRRGDGALHDGVASFGRRPTVTDNGEPLLETYLFDFEGDLYGQTCQVSFFGHLRGEEKFDGLDALTARMRQDEAEARALLSGVRPLSDLDRRLCFPA